MTEPQSSTPTGRGIVGRRQLLALQTFDIARLTTHAVPIVPNTFIAVSGVGPRNDSNGSGKTSFLSAASILLADPQWRLDVNGGRFASGILFKPDAAGVGRAQQIPAAPYGYIVGVFAESEDVAGTCLTVWVRVASSTPYVQARWTGGLHIADAETDPERDLQADSLWNALSPASAISAKRMGEELYGAAPRCLTYLDTPLRPSVPSLLSQQMTEMEPHDIGDSLISLSGLKKLMDEEEQQRGRTLSNRRDLQEAEEKHARATIDEEADLAGVNARERAGEELRRARRYWWLYLERRCQEVRDEDNHSETLIRERADLLREAKEKLSKAEGVFRRLREKTDVADAERKAHEKWQNARTVAEALRTRRAGCAGRVATLAEERRILSPKLDGWSGALVDDAHLAVIDAELQQAAARATRAAAEAAVTVGLDELARAESGRWGHAGRAMDILWNLDSPIPASGLFDGLDIDEDARAQWEPRLWPWRHAVVVEPALETRARKALAGVPGATIVVADASDFHGYMPPGVRSRAPLGQFLSALGERFHYSDKPAHVRDDELGLGVLGGFVEPVTGRDTLVRTARNDVSGARQRLSEAEAAVSVADARLALAKRDHEAATAAARLVEVGQEETGLNTLIAEIDAETAEASMIEMRCESEWRTANGLAQSHAKDLEIAQLHLREATDTEKDHQDRLAEKKRARERLQVVTWHQLLESARQRSEGAEDAVEMALKPASLYRLSREALDKALRLYGEDDEGIPVTGELRRATDLRAAFADQDPSALPMVLLEHVAGPLSDTIDSHADNDQVIKARVVEVRAVRAEALDALRREVADAADRLEILQDMIESQIEGNLGRISEAFDTLDRQRGGFGAEVHFTSIRPNGAGTWRWEVVPRWRRSPSGDLVSYREVANGAQVKVLAVQLVLAAVLSDADSHGRVLVLDELGNSLGEVNRKDVLGALRAVAERQGITILGTCQDSVLVDAAEVCGELLWFTHASATDHYNMPTRVWGFDPSSTRVELTADWIRAGRGLV
ncbi:hypothetical protein [Actinoplanes teichomyceticus]|uniref:Chromosome segregation ATPase n=1 Tax=Actinoplanes teichomyceticus TaxID=1867 RepID=A0A561WIB8_ACTTI|nr:hypothetical protein [Actinoplanes teichomyceticus]TWG23603.1 hypothetical protein FHX34_102152 [Actinoplanes teichomyceticus]GIF11641.1 hypothetical protein Ate01nite_16730 [Actinoplanes teichomyceticus]